MKVWYRILCFLRLHTRSSRPRGSGLQIYCKRCGRFLT